MKQFISEVQDFGKILVLGSGSKYRVGIVDSVKTMLWLPAQQVSVSGFIMVNHGRQGESVQVEPIF